MVTQKLRSTTVFRLRTSVTIPTSVTTIDSASFYQSDLKTVKYSGTDQPATCTNAFIGCTDVKAQVPTNYNGDTFCGITTEKA